MPENVRRSNRKRERHQNPASSPTNLSGGNYHHLPVLDIVLKNIKNQYSGAKPSGACSLGIAGIRALSEGNYHHLPVLDIVLKNIKNQYSGAKLSAYPLYRVKGKTGLNILAVFPLFAPRTSQIYAIKYKYNPTCLLRSFQRIMTLPLSRNAGLTSGMTATSTSRKTRRNRNM